MEKVHVQQEMRPYRNALVKKGRNQLEAIFKKLKDVIPSLRKHKKVKIIFAYHAVNRNGHLYMLLILDIQAGLSIRASRATILKKSAEHIRYMKMKNAAQWQDLEVLLRQKSALEAQIAAMESENSSDDGDEVQAKEEIKQQPEEFCEVYVLADSDSSYKFP